MTATWQISSVYSVIKNVFHIGEDDLVIGDKTYMPNIQSDRVKCHCRNASYAVCILCKVSGKAVFSARIVICCGKMAYILKGVGQ